MAVRYKIINNKRVRIYDSEVKSLEAETTSNNTKIQDNNYSTSRIKSSFKNKKYVENNAETIFDHLKRTHGIYKRKDIDIFNNRYRFGLFNPYESVSNTKEFLFFTKPDLNIYERNNSTGVLTGKLNPSLSSIPFWKELKSKYDDVIGCLQSSYNNAGKKFPFNNLLANMCISNLSIPGLNAETIDTPNNMYGVGFSYRGSSEASNDNFDFDIEFKDTKYLPVYHFFKAYEEYQTLKHHGIVGPWRGYIQDKVLHDQFSIYKFLVDEDMETIMYYCKFYGVIPKSLPRDVFSSSTFDSGLSYSISFKCAFFDDMDPMILNDFNELSKPLYNTLPYNIDIYNDVLNRVDNRPTKAAFIKSETSSKAPGKKIYKLKWKGDATY